MKVIVKNARLSFNDIFTAKCGKKSTTPKFSVTLICSDETTIVYINGEGKQVAGDHAKMQAICEHVMKEKFGKVPVKHSNWAYNKADGSTTRDEYVNDDGDYWDGFDGDTMFISASKHEARCVGGVMTVLDQHKQPLAANSGLLFSGCYVNVVIDVYAFKDDEGGKGATASLEGVQLKKKGEALGFTQIDAASEFDEEEIEEDESADLM